MPRLGGHLRPAEIEACLVGTDDHVLAFVNGTGTLTRIRLSQNKDCEVTAGRSGNANDKNVVRMHAVLCPAPFWRDRRGRHAGKPLHSEGMWPIYMHFEPNATDGNDHSPCPSEAPRTDG